MKKYKGLYRLLNVTMACSLAVSLSLYPVQAEEAATQAQEETAAKEAETAAQSAPKETQAPVQAEATAEETEAAAKAEATAEETEAAAKAEEEKQTSGAEAGNTSATEGAQESSVAASEKDKAAAGAEHASEETTSGENSDHTGAGTEKGSETGTEASGQDVTDKKDTEAGTTETKSDSEKGSEADDKKKDEDKKKGQAGETDPALAQTLSFTVRTKDGTALPVSAVSAPAQITCQGTTHPVDYADGVFQVTVPKGTDALQLLVQKTGKDCGTDLTDLLFFARWGGYLQNPKASGSSARTFWMAIRRFIVRRRYPVWAYTRCSCRMAPVRSHLKSLLSRDLR